MPNAMTTSERFASSAASAGVWPGSKSIVASGRSLRSSASGEEGHEDQVAGHAQCAWATDRDRGREAALRRHGARARAADDAELRVAADVPVQSVGPVTASRASANGSSSVLAGRRARMASSMAASR
jgi:hypothetical protein